MNILWVVYIFCLNFAAGGRILAFFPTISVSHFKAFEPYLIELTNRGHQLVVVSHFPQKNTIQNFTDIDLRPLVKESLHPLNIGENEHLKFASPLDLMHILLDLHEKDEILVIEKTLESLNGSCGFDLIIAELFSTDLFLGFGYKFQAPVVAVSSGQIMPWGANRFAIPDNPSYIPMSSSESSSKMSFKQRLSNSFVYLLYKIMYTHKYIKQADRTARKYFGEGMPYLEELAKQTSLLLTNTHFSISVVRPYPPQVVEVAGIHIVPAKPLPQDIEKFINDSEHGVIYFSFGSLVQSSTMQETTLRAFCDIFSQLPQRVLWKWETKEMPGKPHNVKIVEWTPQRDVLAHPNIRMFISHGGLLGTIEAIHSGVPVLGIPFYGDQMQNIDNLVNLEVGIRLDYLNISKQAVSYAVNTLLDDKKYKENAQRLSKIFKDRPQTPLETAVYWTEYVLRHKGAHHLRSAAVHLPWYQYLLLDVIFVMLSLVIITVLVLYFSIKLMLRKICTSTKKYKTQ